MFFLAGSSWSTEEARFDILENIQRAESPYSIIRPTEGKSSNKKKFKCEFHWRTMRWRPGEEQKWWTERFCQQMERESTAIRRGYTRVQKKFDGVTSFVIVEKVLKKKTDSNSNYSSSGLGREGAVVIKVIGQRWQRNLF